MSEAAHSKLTAKAQTTVPKAVRKALGLKPGDTLVYEVRGDRALLRKASPLDKPFLRALQSTLNEWDSPEDSAFDDL